MNKVTKMVVPTQVNPLVGLVERLSEMSDDAQAEALAGIRGRGDPAMAAAVEVALRAKRVLAAEATKPREIVFTRNGSRPPVAPSVQAQAEPEPPAMVEPQPEPEAPEAPEVVPEAEPDHRDLVLNPDAPYDNAKELLRRQYRAECGQVLFQSWQKQPYEWNGSYYEGIDEEIIEGVVRNFLDQGLKYGSKGKLEPFNPKSAHVREVIDALLTGAALPRKCQPPMWLDTRKYAPELVSFRNGVLNMLTGELIPHTSRLWVHSTRPFDWDAEARCPTWERILDEYWPGEQDSKDLLEEFMGYCMTEETRFHRGLMLIGSMRGGKGTIVHVMRQLVGVESYVGLDLNTWVAGENSTQGIIGKRLGVFNDVRLKPARGASTWHDPGGLDIKSQTHLLSIIAADPIPIGRKYLGPWNGILPTKIVFVSNEIPNLNDPSGALNNRFLKLFFTRSFAANPDVRLKDKLGLELGGIAARCVRAYQRLSERNTFTTSQSAEELEQQIVELSDPVSVAISACFEPDPQGLVSKPDAYKAVRDWLVDNHRPDLARMLNQNRMKQQINAVDGFEKVSDGPRPHGGNRTWLGMRRRKLNKLVMK